MKWNEIFTAPQLVAALRVHAAKLAKRHGYHGIAADLKYAADALEDAQRTVERMAVDSFSRAVAVNAEKQS